MNNPFENAELIKIEGGFEYSDLLLLEDFGKLTFSELFEEIRNIEIPFRADFLILKDVKIECVSKEQKFFELSISLEYFFEYESNFKGSIEEHNTSWEINNIIFSTFENLINSLVK